MLQSIPVNFIIFITNEYSLLLSLRAFNGQKGFLRHIFKFDKNIIRYFGIDKLPIIIIPII